MLKSTWGTFRVLLERRIVSQRPLQDGARKVWNRGITYKTTPSKTVSSQIRTWSTPQLQALRSRFQYSSGWSRLGSSRSSFHPPRRTFHSSKARRSQAEAKETAEPQSLTARLKKLSREYGWAAAGVYLGLTVLDFPFCFLLVRIIGTDRIAEAEHWVLGHIEQIIPTRVKEFWREYRKALKEAEHEEIGNNKISEDAEMVGWGVKEAEERNKEEASLATQLALAYAIHKSFIFIRVPLTAAITPKVVKVLRSWGWQIGKRRPR